MSRAAPHRRRDSRHIAGIVGVVALLLGAAVFVISYNALKGLPGQSRYAVWVDVPDAAHINPTDEVRIAGLRVGQVSEVDARTPVGSRPYAHIELQLDRDVAPLRADTRVSVQTASVLGASYVAITPGTRGRTIAEGGRLPLTQAGRSTQLTDLLDVFDRATARNIRGFLAESGAGVAGRGPALNDSIASFAGMLPAFSRVARTLADPATGLGRFIAEADRASAAFAAASPQLASLVSGGAATFGALADERRALGAAVDAAPGAEGAAATALRHIQPGLDATARVLAALRPAAPLLPGALREANAALVAGTPALRRLPAFAGPLRTALDEVRTLAQVPSTDGAVRKASELFASNHPLFDALAQMQRSCNSLGIWADGFASVFGDIGAGEGPAVAHVEVVTLGADGETLQSAQPSGNLANNQYAHNNDQECESGNEPFTGRQQRSNPPGLQPKKTMDTAPPTGALDRARAAGLIAREPR